MTERNMEFNTAVKLNELFKQLDDLKNDQNWLEDDSKCQLVVNAVSLLDGSSVDHLYKVTPFILRLTDYYKSSVKSKGLTCLAILMNVYNINDLQSANFHQLFWQTLVTFMYNDGIELAEYLVPTLIRFISKFSIDQSKIDDCFHQLVKNVLFTSNKTLKLIYIKGVYQFLLEWPNELVKFAKSILQIAMDIIQDVLNQENFDLIVTAYDVLEIIIDKTAKLSYVYADQLLLAFIKAKFNLMETNLSCEQNFELNKKIEVCLHSLKTHNPDLLVDYCNLIKEKIPQDNVDINFVVTFLLSNHNQ
uniref:Uncharacterized protein n=1 Tax=Tetranychus urticae TaxID=32264 RepID=T1KY44_TETUR